MSDFNCFELNIRLRIDGQPEKNTPAAVVTRALKAVRLLDLLIGRNCLISTRAVDSEYVGPDAAPVVETTLLVNVAGEIPGTSLRNIVFAIAEELEQDCIAVYEPESGSGTLIGPKAVNWGSFNPDYFVRFFG
jgi:hypothetical protein